ncbi:hypothetical protein [Phenylobacterium sp.]|uniref:hypothetical protein n=1 Tax=Phenylobacterium sp. TaxID=1871053 RepID=UPI0035660E80
MRAQSVTLPETSHKRAPKSRTNEEQRFTQQRRTALPQRGETDREAIRLWVADAPSPQNAGYRCKDLDIIDDNQFTNLYKQISFKRWRSKEPYDDPNIIRLENPRLLGRAIQLVLDAGKKHPDEICAELPMSPRLIESFLNLPPGHLTAPTPIADVCPTLK